MTATGAKRPRPWATGYGRKRGPPATADPHLPKYGTLRLVVARNRHGKGKVLATNDLDRDLTTLVLRKRRHWPIETLCPDAKPFCGLVACPGHVKQALMRHVALVLQCLRLHPKETLGEVFDPGRPHFPGFHPPWCTSNQALSA